MKIEEPRNTEKLHFFKELNPGDVFRVRKKYYYIRVFMAGFLVSNLPCINATNLETGFSAAFHPDDVVEPLPKAVLIPNG